MGDVSSKDVLSTDRVGSVPSASSQPLGSTAIAPEKPQDQAIDSASQLPRELSSSHAAHHPEWLSQVRTTAPHLVDDADNGFQKLLPLGSPVTQLPPEILAHIFELYVACVEKLAFGGVLAHGPSRLTQVCKYWRAVAESDPHLWSSMHFYFPESYQGHRDDVSSVQPVFEQHLNRSGALPVSLTFTDHRSYHTATEELISLLVRQLRTHGRRWRRISLYLSGAYFPQLFSFTPCDLSNLEHLRVIGDVFPQNATLQLNLESATNLKSFTYSGPGSSVDDRIYLHWGRLEEVSLEFTPHYGSSYTVSRQFRHLVSCQNITTCSLGVDHARLRFHGTQPILLPRLQTLRVRRLSPFAHASSAIDLLVLPQLQTLEVDASSLIHWNENWHSRNFSGLLARSGCSLLHLSIQDVDFPNDELVRCLALSPALLSLRFIPCPRSQDISSVVRELDISQPPMGTRRTLGNGQQQSPSPGPLVPLLREFTLASSAEGYLDAITAMLRSRVGPRARAAGIAPLRRIGLVFFDMWHELSVDRVRGTGLRSGRLGVVSCRFELDQLMAESGNEDGLEASVVVDSPYLPEYVSVL